MPAAANSPLATSYDGSVTGRATDGSSSYDARGCSSSPASTAHARSMSRCTGIPASRSTADVGLVGKIVCTTTGLSCALAAAAITWAAAISTSWTPPGSVE